MSLVCFPCSAVGVDLGRRSSETRRNSQAQLKPGDRLVLYTDGLTEAMDSAEQEFGELRLIELGSGNVPPSTSELLKTIMDEVSRFSGGRLQDDFTLVVVAVK
jgi:phosphoserine phosphatase RsbU/P